MASGAGKAAQSPGPGSAVNGTAADFPNIEQELYDYQMHSKMCKKIAQLTKVKKKIPVIERFRRLEGAVSHWMCPGWMNGLMAASLPAIPHWNHSIRLHAIIHYHLEDSTDKGIDFTGG